MPWCGGGSFRRTRIARRREVYHRRLGTESSVAHRASTPAPWALHMQRAHPASHQTIMGTGLPVVKSVPNSEASDRQNRPRTRYPIRWYHSARIRRPRWGDQRRKSLPNLRRLEQGTSNSVARRSCYTCKNVAVRSCTWKLIVLHCWRRMLVPAETPQRVP